MSTVRSSIALLLAAGAGSSLLATTPTCSGAELFSQDVVRYGRWEFRMLAAAKPGTVSSFFTYYNDSYLGGGEPWREIDIEVLGDQPEGFQSNLITLTAPKTAKTETPRYYNSSDVSAAFHTYQLDWTPDSVVWRMDGKLVRKATGAQVTELRTHDQSTRMNLWASDQAGWVGAFDLASLPIYQVVNWMTYSSYTPGAGPNGSNFTETWVDDFNTFDTEHWSTGNYGFETNLALFTPKNVKAVNGYLVLALTAKGKEGVSGTFLQDSLGNTRKTTAVQPKPKGKAGLTVFPSTSGLRLERTDAQPSEVQVLDARGRLLAQSQFAPDQKTMSIALASDGLLLVRSGDRAVAVVR